MYLSYVFLIYYVYICIVLYLYYFRRTCNIRLRSLRELYKNNKNKCILRLGAPDCLNVFWFFQANK